jgi:hypothetical protein
MSQEDWTEEMAARGREIDRRARAARRYQEWRKDVRAFVAGLIRCNSSRSVVFDEAIKTADMLAERLDAENHRRAR